MAYSIAIDGTGSVFVTGQTKFDQFSNRDIGSSRDQSGGFDVFVTELSPTGPL